MKRRLIKQKSAYTITLPISWIRENNLETKDEINLTREKDSLIISSDKKDVENEISLDLKKGVEDYCRIMIEGSYLRGYNRIIINLESKEQFRYSQKVISNLIGLEIVEQKQNKIIAETTSEPTEEQFQRMLGRVFNIIEYTQDMIKEDFEKSAFRNKKEIKSQSDDTRRLLLFCIRTLHKRRITSREEESFMHLLLERLILIEHNYNYMYQKLSKIKSVNITANCKKQFQRTLEMFSLFKKMFFRKEIGNFSEITKAWEEIYFADSPSKNTEDSIIDYHLKYLSKLIFLISQPNLTLN